MNARIFRGIECMRQVARGGRPMEEAGFSRPLKRGWLSDQVNFSGKEGEFAGRLGELDWVRVGEFGGFRRGGRMGDGVIPTR